MLTLVMSRHLLVLLSLSMISFSFGNHLYVGNRNSTSPGKIILDNDNLMLDCWLGDEAGGVAVSSQSHINWTLVTPVLTITNRSWHAEYKFNPLQDEDVLVWQVDVPRLSFTMARQYSVPKEQWILSVDLYYNEYHTMTTETTLLDGATEPVLQWDIGGATSDLTPGGYSWYYTTSPCSPDVTVIATLHQPGQLFVTVSSVAFLNGSRDTYNVDLCVITDECNVTVVYDILLVNAHLLVLTSSGLLVSNDLSERGVTRDSLEWNLSQYSQCSSLQLARFAYTTLCQSRLHDSFIDDTLHVLSHCSEEEGIYMSVSVGPYNDWRAYTPDRMDNTTILDMTLHRHMATTVTLYHNQSGTIGVHVESTITNKSIVADYTFPDESNVTLLAIEPHSHNIYAFGKQLWVSEDGGNYFYHLHSLTSHHFSNILFDFEGIKYILQTSSGDVYYSLIGLRRLLHLSSVSPSDILLFERGGQLVSYDAVSNVCQTFDLQSHIQSWSGGLSHYMVPVQLSDKELLMFEYDSGDGIAELTQNNVGQELVYSGGGGGVIETVSSHSTNPAFLTKSTLILTEEFDTHATGHADSDLNIVYDTSDVKLQLVSGVWSVNDDGRCIVIPYVDSFFITSISSSTVARGVSPLRLSTSWTVRAGKWFMLAIPAPVPVWSLHEDECRHKVTIDTTIQPYSMVEIDLHDNITLATNIKISETVPVRGGDQFVVSMSAPDLVSSERSTHLAVETHTNHIALNIHTDSTAKGVFAVRLWSPLVSAQCGRAALVYTVYIACPCRKRLVYEHPRPVTLYQYFNEDPVDGSGRLLFNLTSNYRPPSKQGVAIPTSDHIYNADPSLPRPDDMNRFQISKDSGSYQMCAGKSTRAECGCSDEMIVSDDAIYSDCKTRVSRLVHPGVLYAKFHAQQPNRPDTPLEWQKMLLKLYEINDRVPELLRVEESNLLLSVSEDPRINDSVHWYQPGSVKIFMVRSGIYHYRAELPPGYSFCQLYAEFQVYVDQTPIPYPVQHILRLTVAMILGATTFFIYVWYLSNHHRHLLRPRGSQCQDLQDVKYMQGKYMPSEFRHRL